MKLFDGIEIETTTTEPNGADGVWVVHEHGVQSYIATEISASRPVADILLTKEKNLPLIHGFADCVPIIFFDPKTKAVCFTHAGWKGLTMGSVRISLLEMAKHFGTVESDLQVWIGPCIQKESYVWNSEPLQKHVPGWEEFISTDHTGYAVDLPGYAIRQCQIYGITSKNIVIDDRDTYKEENNLPSHRRFKQAKNHADQQNFYVTCTLIER